MPDEKVSTLLERLQAIVSSIEAERLYDTIVAAVADAVDAQSGVLWVGERELTVAAVKGLSSAGKRLGTLRVEGALAQRLEAGVPFLWPDADPRAPLRVPLKSRGKLVGMLELSDRLDARNFDERERDVAQVYAPFCAIALTNAATLQSVKRKALKDPETETYNLLYFVDYAGKEIYKARRYGRKFSLLVIKLDNLPVIKQALPADRVKDMLKAFVECLRNALRDADTLAKVSDDELWLLLPETDHLGGRLLVQKVFRALAKDKRVQEFDRANPLLLTIGTASYPRDGEDFDMLLARCRERLEDFRQSLWRKQHLGDLGFWDLVSLLVAEEPAYAKLETAIPPRALALTEDRRGRSRHVVMEQPTWARVQMEAIGELARNPDVRGVLFAGVGMLSDSHEILTAAPRAAGALAPIYVIGTAPANRTLRVEATNVTLIPVDDPLIGEHELLFFLTDIAAYAFVGRRQKNGSVYGYHTADPVLVESLVAKLQDQYYLQGRF